MNSPQSYIKNNQNRFLEELIELLKIPSVSADKAFKKDVLLTADFVLNSLQKAGCDHVEICETPGYPIIYGEKIKSFLSDFFFIFVALSIKAIL